MLSSLSLENKITGTFPFCVGTQWLIWLVQHFFAPQNYFADKCGHLEQPKPQWGCNSKKSNKHSIKKQRHDSLSVMRGVQTAGQKRESAMGQIWQSLRRPIRKACWEVKKRISDTHLRGHTKHGLIQCSRRMAVHLCADKAHPASDKLLFSQIT